MVSAPRSFAEEFLYSTGDEPHDRLKNLSSEIRKDGRRKVAEGGYSEVFRGQWRRNDDAGTDATATVCLKFLRTRWLPSEDEQRTKLARRLGREMRIWARLQHRNLAVFHGYIVEGEGTQLTAGFVSQWHSHGNVMIYVRSKPDANKELIVQDIASGLLHLHSREPPIVHGDMKPENVLVDDNERAVITDFGLSTIMDGYRTGQTSSSFVSGGTLRFKAPELVFYDGEIPIRTIESDVWAFGCTCMQILLGERPYAGDRSDGKVIVALERGIDPYDWDFRLACQRTLSKCCRRGRCDRPVMSEIVRELVTDSIHSFALREVQDHRPGRTSFVIRGTLIFFFRSSRNMWTIEVIDVLQTVTRILPIG